MVEIKYLYHSGFAVKTDTAVMVFDYWKYPAMDKADANIPDFLNTDLPVYVFISHNHKDHYNPVVFGWQSLYPYTEYILSKDVFSRCRHIMSPRSVYSGPKVRPDSVHVLTPGELYDNKIMKVRAFGSTDIGVSWLVDVNGKRFFHAGDYNLWLWLDDSSPEELEMMQNKFDMILSDIEAETGRRGLDYVFFPVDSRLGRGYAAGARNFLRRIPAGVFFPMHLSLGDEDEKRVRRRDAANLEEYANPNRGRYVLLTRSGDMYADYSVD